MNDITPEMMAEFRHIVERDYPTVIIQVHAISGCYLQGHLRVSLVEAGLFWRHKTGRLVYTELAVDLVKLMRL